MLRPIYVVGLMCLAGIAHAEPLTRAHTSYYSVAGSSATVLATQLDQKGPVGEDGKHYAARTRWDVQWRFNHDQQGETCGAKDVAVAVGIAQNLPKWSGEDKGPAALRKRWDAFADALKRHEDEHKNHGIQAGAEIEAVLTALKPASNCEDLDKAANAAGEKVIEKYRKRDQELDRTTDHGRKQGATLL
jgi:predicted secreted Zn-dependent protease